MGIAAVGAAVGALPESASASTCGAAATSGNACTFVGTASLGTGTLSLVPPASLAWSGTATAAPQTLYDATVADTSLQVLDLRTPASGWNITASATTFTGVTNPLVTIPDTTAGSVLAFGGGAATPTTAPSAVCVTAGTCVVPTNSETGYPLFIPTSTTGLVTPTTLYDAAIGTGTGIVQIGVGATTIAGATVPAEWQVTLPGGLPSDTYTSTITTTIADGP